MQNLKHAQTLINMSKKDQNALLGMADDLAHFSDEIFGFHAQQAIEKAAKAWLDICNIEYKKIHDITEIFNLLKLNGQEISEDLLDLQDLTEYAVDFRYEPLELIDDRLNRNEILQKVAKFISLVNSKIDNAKYDQ